MSGLMDDGGGPPAQPLYQQQYPPPGAGLMATPPAHGHSQRGSAIPPRPRAPAAHAAQPHQPGLVGAVLRLPVASVRLGFGILRWAIVTSFHVASIVGDRVLPAAVMRGVRGAAAVLTGSAEEALPEAQAGLFVAAFKAGHGDRHPRWVEADFRSACRQVRDRVGWVGGGMVWVGVCVGGGRGCAGRKAPYSGTPPHLPFCPRP